MSHLNFKAKMNFCFCNFHVKNWQDYNVDFFALKTVVKWDFLGVFYLFTCLNLQTEISCVIYECKWRKIRDVLELEMMIAGQVGKWEEFFAFFFIICTSFLSANVQIGGGQALHEEELKIGILKFWVGHCMWGRCKNIPKISLSLGMPNQPNWKTNRNPSYWHLTRHGGFLKEFDMCLYTSHYLKMAKKISYLNISRQNSSV